MSDPGGDAPRSRLPAHVIALTDDQRDDLSSTTTVQERIAMVAVLTQRMWELTGRPIPSYSRSEIPVRVLRSP